MHTLLLQKPKEVASSATSAKKSGTSLFGSVPHALYACASSARIWGGSERASLGLARGGKREGDGGGGEGRARETDGLLG